MIQPHDWNNDQLVGFNTDDIVWEIVEKIMSSPVNYVGAIAVIATDYASPFSKMWIGNTTKQSDDLKQFLVCSSIMLILEVVFAAKLFHYYAPLAGKLRHKWYFICDNKFWVMIIMWFILLRITGNVAKYGNLRALSS
jgi:hypothetical protein